MRETIKVELRIEEANHEVEFLGGGGRGIKREGNRGEQSWGEGPREEGWENEIGDSIRDYGYVYLRERERERERESFAISTSMRSMVVKIAIQGHKIVRFYYLQLKIDSDHARIVCNARSK